LQLHCISVEICQILNRKYFIGTVIRVANTLTYRDGGSHAMAEAGVGGGGSLR